MPQNQVVLNHNALRPTPSCPPFPFWAAAPKGPMTYAFTHIGEIFPPSSPSPPSTPFKAHILALGPKLPQGPNPSHEAQYPTF